MLLLRVWFGYTMMDNGRFIFDKSNESFFLDWFGKGLHFTHPLLMYYLAKGSEFFGGLFILLGMGTRIVASFVAFTMMVATLTANIHDIYTGDGSITISFFLVALLFVLIGGGRWSIDFFLFKKRRRAIPKLLLLIIRIWLGSLLIYTSILNTDHDAMYLFFVWASGKLGIAAGVWVTSIPKGIELACGVLLMLGLFRKISSTVIAVFMLIITIFSKLHFITVGDANHAYVNIYFWLSALVLFFRPQNWSLERRAGRKGFG